MLLPSIVLAAQEPPRKTLSTVEIKQVLAGKVAADDHHWLYCFKTDGSVSGTELGSAHKGRWRVRDGRLCLNVPIRTNAHCMAVVKEGEKYIFRTDGVDLSDVTIVPYRAALQVE